jgi:hypothetical protein
MERKMVPWWFCLSPYAAIGYKLDVTNCDIKFSLLRAETGMDGRDQSRQDMN